MCKCALSTVSIENARRNMEAEARSWRLADYVERADSLWDARLSTVEVKGSEKNMKMFYTALYHAFIQPNQLSDVNGEYTATDYTTQRTNEGDAYYSTFSLWDTFRALHPLYTLIAPKDAAAFCQSMLAHARSYGYLPIWDLWGQDNYCMIGNPAIPVVVDAALKGLDGIDAREVLDAAVMSDTTSHPGSDFEAWERYGYMPEDILSQSVSITMEQSFDDWCVAQLAKKLGRRDIYERMMRRSAFYRNLYNAKTRFFQARNAKGAFVEPFDPLIYGANGGNPYTEGNAWQWYWSALHDIDGLIELTGGKKAFEAKLDSFFTIDTRHGEKNSNASGFIGQYVHGNEPSHHVAYLYNWVGRPEKTQRYVHQIVSDFYNTSSSGYAGNDDCGEMSAWLIFSALGFYPVNPISQQYVLGTPLFDEATLHLPNNTTFKVRAQRRQPATYLVKKTMLNGRKLSRPFITHEELMRGGELVFEMK